MRALVTGARGLLGTDVVRTFADRHHVTAVDVDEFDITDLEATVAAFREASPDTVVHCAAWSDVDGAEASPDAVFRANGIGARNAALAANEVDARLIHISTDYIFDGTSGRPYLESDTPNPLGIYGRSKWMGEEFVRDLCADWTVVRTQALYGPRGRSFPSAILARLRSGEPLRVVDDQTVCPTRSADLARALLMIAEEGAPGVYHASSRGECTWYAFAEAILAAMGAADHPLTAIATADLDLAAPRPAYSVLRNLHLELTIGDPFPRWREALLEHLATERRP